MRKFILLILMGILAAAANAQISESERNDLLGLLNKNKIGTGLSDADIQNSIITHSYLVPESNIRMVYLQQSFKGIPVYNQLNIFAFKNDELLSKSGGRIQDIKSLGKSTEIDPRFDHRLALAAALTECKIDPGLNIKSFKASLVAPKFWYGDLGVSSENISAELLWFPVNEGKQVKLAWQVFIVPLKSSDYWLIRVDADNGEIISKESLTVYCNWDKEHNSPHDLINVNPDCRVDQLNNATEHPFVVNNSNYRVIAYPAESPIHPGGAHAIHSNPWTMAPGNATSLGWHFDGATYYSNTRGNNVYAYEDRNADNLAGLSPNSTSAQPDLSFDFIPDYLVEPTVTSPAPNQQFNTTNLFYWNNLIHDIAYIYGFTESARNFQNNNQGLGGAGADYVLAEAQDGRGTNNANFGTPPDGSRPRMQMYLWTAPTPDRDGDVDNGIIIHEYTHGISNRLTGNGYSCLGNAEQMGEGWSDYFALMLTHDWSTAMPGDGFSKPRGIGTYAKNQPADGLGIRQYRYTTDMSVNPMTYGNLPTVVHPHGTGTIWCTVLWDMTWEIIQTAGINPSLHNIGGSGGNAIALKLVLEGMRLQPCSPGFIDGRDAILQADNLFFGGQYHCAIINAFARRGMGTGALQGSSNSRTDQTLSFVGCTPGPCNTPEGLSSSGITANSATVSWGTVAGASSYDLDYKVSSSGTWINWATAMTSTSATLTGLAASKLYDWRVKTNCPPSSSAYAAAQFTTTSPAPDCPGQYDVSTNGNYAGAAAIPLNTDIKGLINPRNDMDYYKFTITTAGTINITLTMLPANYDLKLYDNNNHKLAESKNSGTANETINRNVTAGVYFALVLPKGDVFNAASCYNLKVSTGTASLFEGEIISGKSFQVYPNPVTKTMSVNIPKINGQATIKIFDMFGRLIIQQNSWKSNNELDLGAVPAGIYLLSVTNNGKESGIKIIKL